MGNVRELTTAGFKWNAIGLVSYGILFLLASYIASFYWTLMLADVVRLLSLNIVINSMGIVPCSR